MKRTLVFLALAFADALWGQSFFPQPVKTDGGLVAPAAYAKSGVRAYLGIPYAAPPVGDLRWKAPQPAAAWTGIRQGGNFGPRCMQARVFDDMIFRDSGGSEDCLYLNVWTPADTMAGKLPVMVWIYGGGFVGGAASEPRQDGANLAAKNVIVVSMNYRLGVFGFLAHPDLVKESEHHASGNYGLLDQVAALQWVQRNIAAFGGDPQNVTIFGESAGSFSVSGLVASPLAKGLFEKAIGESGSFLNSTGLPAKPLNDAATQGQKFGESVGAHNIAALRAIPAADLLAAAMKPNTSRVGPDVDGYYFPEDPKAIFAKGAQNHVALIAGWNANELPAGAFFGKDPQTKETFKAHVTGQYKDHTDSILKLYPASTDEEAVASAGDLASDNFIAFSTWKWLDMHLATGGAPVYRYHFMQSLPAPAGSPRKDLGAYHSAEIEFVFHNLDNKDLPWRPSDREVSDMMSSYWANFARTGDPNGPGLPKWPQYTKEAGYPVFHISATPEAKPDTVRERYVTLDSMATK
jgi:para-nitrobenzyl esterase